MYDREFVRDRVMPTYSIKIEDDGKTTHRSDGLDTQLQSPERTETGVLVKSHKEKSALRGKWELSVESNRTVFKRRLFQFQSWRSTGKTARLRTKETIVLSADTERFWSQRRSPSGKRGRYAFKKILRGVCTNPSCD